MTPELAVVSDPEFVGEIVRREMGELRAMRSRCQSLENSLSYVRRLIQGRVDIVGGELQRRHDGGDAGNTSELIGRLPDILADGSRAGGGPGSVRPPQTLEPDPAVTEQLEAKLEQIIAGEDLGNVSALTVESLQKSLEALKTFEIEVSDHRRILHNVIDTVQAEVTRRYTTGEATVDSLLQ